MFDHETSWQCLRARTEKTVVLDFSFICIFLLLFLICV